MTRPSTPHTVPSTPTPPSVDLGLMHPFFHPIQLPPKRRPHIPSITQAPAPRPDQSRSPRHYHIAKPWVARSHSHQAANATQPSQWNTSSD